MNWSFADPPLLVSLEHPDWWEVDSAVGDGSGLFAILQGVADGASVGRIVVRIEAIREQESDAIGQRLVIEHRRWLEALGLHALGSPLLVVAPTPHFDSCLLWNASGSFEGHDFDLPLLVLQRKSWAASVGLVGASREESPEWWEINKGSFEIVRDSLRVGDDALSAMSAAHGAAEGLPDAGAFSTPV